VASAGTTPDRVLTVWEKEFDDAFARIQAKHPKIRQQPTFAQLGTLGTGNHFIEVCQDLEDGGIWCMLHSGSRGVGNRLGTYFIEQAKKQALKLDHTVKVDQNLPGWTRAPRSSATTSRRWAGPSATRAGTGTS
jgi:RNA-splicing ligase RtcB